uniref:Beta-1,4-N-acetylgalactosaminyltransferase n=1 Tax=Plectus sambesii TaxID=2011161 RepID=A0A914VD94_9BILA
MFFGKFPSKIAKLLLTARFRLLAIIAATGTIFYWIDLQLMAPMSVRRTTMRTTTIAASPTPLPQCVPRIYNSTDADNARLTVMTEDISETDLISALTKFVEKSPTELFRGPKNCSSSHRVAIIIPFRGRDQQLRIFLRHMHPFLSSQLLEYEIFVVQQRTGQTFNRGKLMNVGFDVARRFTNWTCYIFHDVDLIPEDSRNLYTCSEEQPRHLSVAVDKFRYRLPYQTIFGGACALTEKQLIATNGFPNSFWGWGGEDDDMSRRTRFAGYKFQRRSSSICIVFSDHRRASNRWNFIAEGRRGNKEPEILPLARELLDRAPPPYFGQGRCALRAFACIPDGKSRRTLRQVAALPQGAVARDDRGGIIWARKTRFACGLLTNLLVQAANNERCSVC